MYYCFSVDPYGLIGQWLTDALNPSVYTFEVAPVMTIMEETVLTEMRKFLGYSDGKGDGIFCPGGSIANGYAINCARFYAFPEVKVGYRLNGTADHLSCIIISYWTRDILIGLVMQWRHVFL